MQRKKLSNFLKVFTLVLAVGFVAQCTSNNAKQKKNEVKTEDFLSEDDIFDDISKAKKIFYALPSPLETAQLIKSAGAEYNEQLLNPTTNTDNYSSNKSLALNLGIYTTDLSFASLFDQSQTSVKYMEAARKMAENLDITDAIDDATIKRLEENLNNRDVIMDIISETFLNSSSYLKENDRPAVAAVVLVGGWIEGLYIATQLVGEKPIEDNELVKRIAEQKLSYKIVEKMLDENKKNQTGEENQDITTLVADLDGLKAAFDKIKVETSEIKVEPGTDTNVAVLKSSTKITITPEDFKELQETVKTLRTRFVQ